MQHAAPDPDARIIVHVALREISLSAEIQCKVAAHVHSHRILLVTTPGFLTLGFVEVDVTIIICVRI